MKNNEMEDLLDTPKEHSSSFHQTKTLPNSELPMYKAIFSASLIYVILSYLNTFGNTAMYIVSYLRASGNNPNVNYNTVSLVFSLAVLLQSLSGFFTAPVESYLGTRKATILGCAVTALSVIGCAFSLRRLYQLVFFYSVVAGIASGMIFPLPLDAAIRTNPSKRGYICGSVFFYGGLITILLCPLQTFYVNKGDIRLSDIISPSDKEIYYKDLKMLNRLPNLFIIQGCLYLLILLICIVFLDFPKDREPEPEKEPEIEYETFITKRLNSSSESSNLLRERNEMRQCVYLWFLIYLSWQSIIYLQSYWKIVALLKHDSSDLFITLIGAAASTSHIFGRIIWGFVFDLIGWKPCWFILVLSTLVLTFTSHLLFEYNLYIYALWVCTVFFVHSGVFSIGPMTAHKFFGPNKFIMSVGFLNTARAASGMTAVVYANLKFSRWNDYLPITVSLICLLSLLIIRLFKPGPLEDGT